MDGSLRLGEEIVAFGVELRLLCTEVVVYRSAFEYALLYAATLAELVVVDLDDDTQAFHEEDAAEYGRDYGRNNNA